MSITGDKQTEMSDMQWSKVPLVFRGGEAAGSTTCAAAFRERYRQIVGSVVTPVVVAVRSAEGMMAGMLERVCTALVLR